MRHLKDPLSGSLRRDDTFKFIGKPMLTAECLVVCEAGGRGVCPKPGELLICPRLACRTRDSAERVKQSQSLSWLHFDATVSEAEGLLSTQYFEYTHESTGQAHVACEEYSLPEDIKKHIDFVTPTVHFDAKVENPKKRRTLSEDEIAIAKRQTSTTGHNVVPGIGHSIGSPGDKSLPKSGGKISNLINELENCDVSIVPDCLRALYEFPPNFPPNSKSKSGPSSCLLCRPNVLRGLCTIIFCKQSS